MLQLPGIIETGRNDLQVSGDGVVLSVFTFSAAVKVRLSRSTSYYGPPSRVLLLLGAHNSHQEWQEALKAFIRSESCEFDVGFSQVLHLETIRRDKEKPGGGFGYLESEETQQFLMQALRNISLTLQNMVPECKHVITKRSSWGFATGQRLFVSRAGLNNCSQIFWNVLADLLPIRKRSPSMGARA